MEESVAALRERVKGVETQLEAGEREFRRLRETDDRLWAELRRIESEARDELRALGDSIPDCESCPTAVGQSAVARNAVATRDSIRTLLAIGTFLMALAAFLAPLFVGK